MLIQNIPFNRPYITGNELKYISEAANRSKLAGDGIFTHKCSSWLKEKIGCDCALLTHSCTAALEMSALLLDIKKGDEIIMPSYTFVSTANAFVLRGGIPVFIDIREDTLNIDETLIEAAITPKTRAIVVVHYAGIACEMDTILAIAKKYGLMIIEDAAQGILSTYKTKPLGSIGAMGTLSFHETKNITCGEGGALLINEPRLTARAEILREKGTNRKAFFNGEVDKYTWVDIGSSYLPAEVITAFLWAQLEQTRDICEKRLSLWHMYHEALLPLEQEGLLRRPIVPKECTHNAHMYYIILHPKYTRNEVLEALKQHGIGAIFHYIPLHSSTAGKIFSRSGSLMHITNSISSRIIRLPLYYSIEKHLIIYITEKLRNILYNQKYYNN